MKQFLRYILTLVVILLTTTNAWAECTIFSDGGEYEVMKYIFPAYRGVEKAFTISNPQPSGILTFTYWAQTAAIGGVDVTATYSDGTNEKILSSSTGSNPSYNFNGKIVTKLTFKGTSGTLKKTISNVKLTRHTSISASPATLPFPLTAVGTTSNPQTVTITYSNIGNNYNITSTNTNDFSISPLPFTYDKCAGEMQFAITFHPQGTTGGARYGSFTIAGDGNGKSNNFTSITISVNGTAKGFPEFTWKGNTQYYVDESLDLSNLWTTTSNETTPKYSIKRFTSTDTFGSADPHFTDATNTKILLSKEGKLVLQMHQDASTTYSPLTKEITIDIVKRPTDFALNFANEYYVDDEINKSTFFTDATNSEVAIQVSDKTADNRALFTYNGSILKANGATLNADSETTTITVTQPENYKWTSYSLDTTVTVKKRPSNFSWQLTDTYYVDDVITSIFSKAANNLPTTITSSDPNIVKVEGNQLIALNAGEVTITATQDVDRKWVAFTQTKKVTILKHNIVATITPDNAFWNELIRNPFAATSKHPVSGQVTPIDNDNFNVEQQGNEHIALMDTNTRYIQTYYTNGTVDFLITRDEDDKYNALNQTLTLHVNQSEEVCYIDLSNYDPLKEYATGYYDNRDGFLFGLEGKGNVLSVDIKKQGAATSNGYIYIIGYDKNNSETRLATIKNTAISTSYTTHTCTLDTTITKIRIKSSANIIDDALAKFFKNVRITRAKELTPSDSPVILPVTSIRTEENKTFTLKWSTCADEIILENNNPHFKLDTYRIQPTNNEGSTAIKVTCDASVVGTLRDTIVIYDQTQRIFVPVVCEVNDKFIANIKGTTAYNKKVDDTWVADFKFDTCQTTLPSDDINAPFYYTIKDDLTGNDVQKTGYENQVISYNPQNYTITAHNAGTAVITFIQKPTISHYTDTFRCVITVSKHDVELQWKDPVYYNDTISNYFTTTDTISPIVIVSETDTDVAKLTKTTSNNSLDLITFNKEASTIVTVSQAENYKWNGYSEPHTITPIDPNNHVTFTIDTEAKMNIFHVSHTSGNSMNWSNNSIQIGGGWDGFEYAKELVICFTGIPKDLTFTYGVANSGTTGEVWDVYESTDGTNWSASIWHQEGESGTCTQQPLNPDTRFLKFRYGGNFGCYFKNIHVTELNQFEAIPDTLNFGQLHVDEPSLTKTFDFKYANAGYKVQFESTDTMFTITTTYIDTIGGEKYGTVKDIQVSYRPTHVHNTNATGAKILIWDEAGNRDTVHLVANTIKSKPSLHWTEAWKAKEPIVLLNQTVTNAAESTNGYSTVKYTSSDPSIIKVSDDGTSFQGIGLGKAIIIAYQDSDRVYEAPDPIQKTFLVTDKRLQYILWEDNLTDFCIDDEQDTLRAQVWVMTDAANGTWEYSPEQTAKLQYSSPNVNIATVADSILTIHGLGEMFLTATVPADTTYEMASAQIPVRVRDCSVQCTDADLVIPVINANGTVMMPEDKLEYDPYALWDSEKIVAIDTTAGIPGHLIFAYYGRKAWDTLEGKIRVFESTDGGTNWQQILSDADAVKPLNQQTQYSPYIPLSRNATHIKFERFDRVKLGYHILQYITITPAQYIESIPDDIDFGNVYLGNTVDTIIDITYSSIRSNLQLASSQPSHLTIDKTTIEDECGAWDTDTISLTLIADISIVGNYHQYVTVTDPIGGMTDTIHVYANIVKNTPTITWETTLDTIRSSAEWETQKTAFASSGDLVLYELTAGNQLAYLNDNGKMILLRGGRITARAYTAETTTSNEVSAYHKFYIIVDPLFEDFDNDSTWNNDNNWNIGRIPWTTDSATIAANKHVSLDTVIITEGLSFESGGSIHITSTGGLSVGAQGIKGAATDGSSITIDNLKTGAGFLRISPEYTGTMPKTTVRYQTRSTLDTGANKNATWQYIGAPGADCQFTVDYITWLYQWSEPQNWINKTGTLTLTPFAGYAITQYGQPIYSLKADPICTNDTITLTKTPEALGGMNGDNLFANSYMAPIDVKNFTEDDFSGDLDKTFYIFNSGSWNQWNGQNEKDSTLGSNGSTTPGQYCAIPALSATYLDSEYDITTIPPMQGVYVIANEDSATIRLNYNKHIWQAGTSTDASTNLNEPMRAPQRQAQEQMQQDDFRRLRLQVNSANSGADRMYIIQESTTTRDYDNGYDAPNQFAEGIANIYTTEPFGKMEVSCANNIDSMYIGFQAGCDDQYTLSFRSLIGDSLYLKDMEQDTIIRMEEGAAYRFSATPYTTNDLRFLLLLHPQWEADNTPTQVDQVQLMDIWNDNTRLYITNAPTNSIATIYTISGQPILHSTIQYTTHTIDIHHLPQGVYILRINNQIYKFVCQ